MRSALFLPEVRWAATSRVAFLVAVALGAAGAPWPVVGLVYLVCYVTGGWEPALQGLRTLQERRLDVDLLMIVAAVAAAAIGQWFDGGLLVVIFATSGALEAAMTARTRASITALLDIAPETATLIDTGASGDAAEVNVRFPRSSWSRARRCSYVQVSGSPATGGSWTAPPRSTPPR